MTDKTEANRLTTADMAAAAQHNVAPAPDPGPQARDVQGAQDDGQAMPLLDDGEAGSFRSQWALIQAGFVDDPRTAVEQGDGLVAELMQRLAEIFADERAGLEAQWTTGSDVSTEDLRLALRRYRSFFDRLLSM